MFSFVELSFDRGNGEPVAGAEVWVSEDRRTVTAADGTVATVSIVVNGQDGVIDPTPNTTIGGDLMGAVIEAGSDNNNGTPTDSGQLTAMNPDGPDDSFRPVSSGSATAMPTMPTTIMGR